MLCGARLIVPAHARRISECSGFCGSSRLLHDAVPWCHPRGQTTQTTMAMAVVHINSTHIHAYHDNKSRDKCVTASIVSCVVLTELHTWAVPPRRYSLWYLVPFLISVALYICSDNSAHAHVCVSTICITTSAHREDTGDVKVSGCWLLNSHEERPRTTWGNAPKALPDTPAHITSVGTSSTMARN
jgi:hypothetical protein